MGSLSMHSFNKDELIDKCEQLQAELDKYKEAIGRIYDITTEGYIIEMIDVLRGNAVWDEEGVADYDKKRGADDKLQAKLDKHRWNFT